VETLARLIAGNASDSIAHNFSQDAAFAELEILQIRAERFSLFNSVAAGTSPYSSNDFLWRKLQFLDMQKIMSERLLTVNIISRKLRRSTGRHLKTVAKDAAQLAAQQADKIARTIEALRRLERYERRALSCRDRALRQLHDLETNRALRTALEDEVS
jgi:hypothetical protein